MAASKPAGSALRYFGLNCTLKGSPAESSTERLLHHVGTALEQLGVTGSVARVVDHNVAFGVGSDEGNGDEWPALRRRILEADIFVLGTPIWLGHPASVCQMVMERLDAFLGETDDQGRMVSYDRVAIVGVVGNEDGAHHVGASVFQGLNDVGFTIPAGGMAYWVGEAMQSTDFKDLDPPPAKTMTTVATMTRNAVHLADRLRRDPYPAAP
ncbi:MAG: NAD(P)H-dependent oxidoreductase [Acidimicrobiia bacterium]|nr:NAD(P)H-dependent oxidoreductase [Acidimicrobiia bacterium]